MDSEFIYQVYHNFLELEPEEQQRRIVAVLEQKLAKPRISTPNLVSASDVGYCPLKAAYKKKEAQPVFPNLNLPGKSHVMLQGVLFGTVLQSAFYDMDSVEIEKYVRDSNYEGHIDIYLPEAVLEIKNRRGGNGQNFPRPQDVFQIMTYMMLSKTWKGFIILNKFPFYSEFFNIKNTLEVYSFNWGEMPQFKLPHKNWDSLYADFSERLSMAKKYLTDENMTEPPIQLNSDEAWQCHVSDGKSKKPACPYFCHGSKF